MKCPRGGRGWCVKCARGGRGWCVKCARREGNTVCCWGGPQH